MKTTECYFNIPGTLGIHDWWKHTSDQQIEPGSNRKVPVHECHRSIVIIGIIGTAYRKWNATRNASWPGIARVSKFSEAMVEYQVKKSRTFVRSVSNQTDRNRPRCRSMRVDGMRVGFKSRISNYTYRSECRKPIKFVWRLVFAYRIVFQSYIAICRLETSRGNRRKTIHYKIAKKISAIAS